MMKYIPDELYINKKNMKAVSDILHSVPETSIRHPSIKTLDDAIEEIRGLGENKIADFLSA